MSAVAKQTDDAELIRLCKQAEEAHHTHIATGEVWCVLPHSTPEGVAAEAVYVAAGDELQQQISALCTHVPSTLAGHAAMARLALTIMVPYRPIHEDDSDRAMNYVPEPLVETILTNLAGGVA
jgi:hypothetical protein